MQKIVGWIGVSVWMLGLVPAFAAMPSAQSGLPDFDLRNAAGAAPAPASDQAAALKHLQARLPEARVDFDNLLHTPAWISVRRGFLTGPESNTAPDHATKAFLAEHRALFDHGPEALDTALVKRRFVTAHNGMRTVVWQQQVEGIPVFDALLVSHTTRNGELINISSRFLPDPGRAADATTLNRAALQARPPVTAVQAVINAAQNLGDTLATDAVTVAGKTTPSADQHQSFKASALKGNAEARLVWLPMNRDTLRLCWEIVLMSRARDEMYQILVDAQSGQPLLRRDLTENLTDATYRVYYADSPTPFSPGHATPLTNQPPEISRVLIVTNAFNTNASPNGWINDGDNETTGNNVDAHLDQNSDNLPDLPRPRGAPFRVFDPPIDLTQEPAAYGDAAVVNLFFWNNWMHDKLYEFGFTEAAGNFQVDNFDRGGLGGDSVEAEAQDGSGYNNANFSTPPDGYPPWMQMYLFTGPTPNRDGDLDTQIILHEYTHGLSGRLVGGGVGISALQSRGLGEGWSDFYSLALLSKPGDDLNANYPEGAYVAFHLYGLEESYYFGIRRYPYTTDLSKNPLTFKDIDPGQAGDHAGVPLNPAILNQATEIHNQGEVWCVTLWDARANLINKYGYATGNELILQLLTDALCLTPANPNFIQARDAIIQADLVDNGGANYYALWKAFAKRGLGINASAPGSFTTSGVVESFALPDPFLVTPGGDLNASGAIGGPFTPAAGTYLLHNTGTNFMDWAAGATAGWVDLSASAGTLAPGATTNVIVALNATAASFALGDYAGVVTFSNLTSGASQSRNLSLSVAPLRIYFFSLDTDPGWTREGQWAFGQPAGHGGAVHGSPDPTNGVTGTNVFGVNLDGDYATAAGGPYYLTAGPLDFSDAGNLQLQFQRWLNSDYQPFATATIDVSTNGTDWTPLFANAGVETVDAGWTNCQYDLSPLADNQPVFYVRWGYEITQGAFAYSGWNLDDIEFLGMSKLKVVLPFTVSEAAGFVPAQGHVRVSHPAPQDVVIHLASSAPDNVTVTNVVTLPAGETNVDFDLDIADDLMLTGPRTITITATANGYADGTNSFGLLDDESAALSVTLPVNAMESDGLLQGTVSCSVPPDVDVAITLISSDTNSLQVPATVLLPAGQTTVDFQATVLDDLFINGNRDVTVTAQVENWTNGVGLISIIDNESTNLTLTLPAQARQSNGVLTNAGLVQVYGLASTNLWITLAATNTNDLELPAGIFIPAGQTSALFDVTIVDAGQAYGTLPIQVTASADGFASSDALITLMDNQTPPAPFHPSPVHLSTNNSTLVTLSWNPGLGEGVEQSLNGNLEMGSLANWSLAMTNGTFDVDDGTTIPPSGDDPTPPFAGAFSALASQSISGISVMYQDIALPANASAVVLGWADRIRNFSAAFTTNQQFQVQVRDTNDAVQSVVFSTQAGDGLLGDWTQRSADLSAFAGQTIRLAFVLSADDAPLEVHLDEITLRAANVPPVAYDVYFGTNTTPGLEEFQGSTTNTFWPLPPLVAWTDYYWQVVARRTNETAGPVWQFSSLPTLSVADATVVEGNAGTTNAVFNVQLIGGIAQPVAVDFQTLDNSAFAPDDYAATNGTLVFNPGDTNLSVVIPVNGDTSYEPDETFLLSFSSTNAILLNTNLAAGVILNDDAPPPGLLFIADTNIYELTQLVITNTVSNAPANTTLSFSLDPGAPDGAAIDPETGIFTWTPTEEQGPGSYFITVRATDDGDPPLDASQSFVVNVAESNCAPVLTAISNLTVYAGTAVSISANATDTDLPANGLIFTLDPGAPSGADIDPYTGQFAWICGEAEAGTTNTITVRVTDNGDPPLDCLQTFTIAVIARPVITGLAVEDGHFVLTWSAIEGHAYRVQYKDDIEGDWTDLEGGVIATGEVATKTDPDEMGTQRFYRILAL